MEVWALVRVEVETKTGQASERIQETGRFPQPGVKMPRLHCGEVCGQEQQEVRRQEGGFQVDFPPWGSACENFRHDNTQRKGGDLAGPALPLKLRGEILYKQKEDEQKKS